jgi:hypothetical protein
VGEEAGDTRILKGHSNNLTTGFLDKAGKEKTAKNSMQINSQN